MGSEQERTDASPMRCDYHNDCIAADIGAAACGNDSFHRNVRYVAVSPEQRVEELENELASLRRLVRSHIHDLYQCTTAGRELQREGVFNPAETP